MTRRTAIRQEWLTGRRAVLVTFWAAGAVLFALMSAFAALRDTFPGDLFLSHRWQDVDVPALGGALSFVNAVGSPVAAALIAVGAALFALVRRRWLEAVLILLTFVPHGLQSGIKELVGRARPSDELVRVTEQASGPAFPSGHVVGAVVLYGLLLYLAPRLIGSHPLRLVLQLFCAFMIVATGPARVHAGAHWPSDVVGGYLLGFLCLALLLAVDRVARGSVSALADRSR
jgi:membrane-associated phospholipid phosphatase